MYLHVIMTKHDTVTDCFGHVFVQLIDGLANAQVRGKFDSNKCFFNFLYLILSTL